MERKDKLKIIHNALKLLAPDKEYDLSDYDVFIFRCDGYVQIFSIHKSIYIETNSGLPPEVLALFKVYEVSDVEAGKVYDINTKSKIGYLPSEINLYDDMTVKGIFDYHESFYDKDISERRNELVEIIGTPCDESILYKATPIDKDLFKTI